MRRPRLIAAAALAAASALVVPIIATNATAAPTPSELTLLGTYQADAGDGIGGEVSAVQGDRMYVTKGATVEIVDISNPSAPVRKATVDLAAYGASVTSVAVHGLTVAATLPAADKTARGKVVLLTLAGKVVRAAEVGSLPDMVTFDETGLRLLVANEGEPNSYGAADSVDPEGSVSVVSVARLAFGLPGAVENVGFGEFNTGGTRAAELPKGVRVYGPGASVAQDLEPEFITTDPANPTRAWVTLQENNAIAEISLGLKPRIAKVHALGTIDRSLPGNGFDASDRDSAINIANYPVKSLLLPDAVAAYQAKGGTFLVTANEGDVREWPGLTEASRLGSSAYANLLDPAAFPNAAALKNNAALGRLNVSTVDGKNAEGKYSEIVTYGGRSFSIFDAKGQRVFDSGDDFEQITAQTNPSFFNSNNDENSFDTRSDDKGPEPEGVAVGTVGKKSYAFVALERVGGVMVYDVTDPASPSFVQYLNNREFTASPVGPDSGPEVVKFVDGWQSPTHKPVVIVSNEVSGSVSLYSFS